MIVHCLRNRRALLVAALLFGACRAGAETTNCTNITSLPAIITTQGVHCLKQDLATSNPGINVIDVRTNNVTIDCNDHKLGGLGAGPATFSVGIYAFGQSNITVRNCNIRGFRWGIAIYGTGGGHLVEDNLLDGNVETGLMVRGETGSSIVRRNRVLNTGGKPGLDRADGIQVNGDAIDNVVDGVYGHAAVANFTADGLYSEGAGSVVVGNRVRNLKPAGTGEANGISAAGTGIVVRDNTIVQDLATAGHGVYCSLIATLYGNRIKNYSQPMPICQDAGGNVTF